MTAPFRATVLSRAAQDLKKYYNLSSFEVDTVLVVTWVGVEPFKHFQQEKNTFQAVFISGWNGEYQNGHGLLKGEETSYVIFLYQKGQMNWTYKLGQPINVGFTGFALPDTDTLLVSMLDKINGNTGEQGVYTYLTGQSSGPIQACHRYICNNLALLSDPVYEYDKTDLFKCPCTMERLGHQWQLFQTRGENHDIQCYAISHLAKIRLRPNNKRNKLCCYKMGKPKHPEDWRDVEQTRREASYVPASGDSGHVLINEPWPEFYFNIDEVLENVEAHKICCADSTRELCGRFYQIFPDMGCTDFVVFVTASALGDPHITTLDGVTYTMNGWGEYILMDVKSKNFTLQARTGRVESLNGSADNATVFTAFAASEGGYAKFQVQLANNNRTMIVYVNGMDVTHDFNNDREFQMLLDKISVLREDSSNKTLVIATFPCGISIKVSVAVKSLDIELEIDKSLENKTLGLLGNFNHNQTDEFTLPNGTVLASKMSERELLYSFGRHWEVSAHNTIFAYGKGENSSTFSHPDFVPLFGDEVSPETTRVAEQTCGENNTECIIDYVVTGSQEFASSTMQSFLKQQSFVSNLANNPPELSLKNDSLNSLGQWNVTESKDWTLEVFPEDADGDVVSIELVGNHTGASVRNRSIIYTPDAKNPINLGIRAKDSKGAYSPIVYVTIAVCTGCNGHGACTLNTRNTDNSEGYFQVLQCSCFPAYTGSDCESELDACASKPCSVGQECTDLTAAQQGNNVTGYVCGPCPVGYSDYDKKCVDTNECTESNGLCQHNCTNTEGSFICSCRQGFRLDATNKKTCTDVNECEEQTSQCKHTCKNTEGSYNCSCYEGYDLKSDGYTCELTSNGKRECEHCQHTCLFNETTNTASCVCDKGYKPDPNNTNECLDINECELLNMPCSQSCNNTEGNFKCYCYTGFKLESDMVSCKACEIPSYGEDCAKTCQCNGRGSCNTVKGCVCDVNWTGVNCDIDVDECATQGSCPEGQLCLNTYGSFTCSCPTGYVFAGQVCNDTDECSNLQINVTCDLRKEVCINTVGSYWCDCKQGYARNNNSTCQDIDECALHIDGCQHMCHNVEGRFNCECDYGYILEDNRKSCTRIRDLCVGHQLNCTHGCSVDDTNKPYCICPRGYTRNRNVGQDTCIDINECTSPENNSCFYKTGCNNTDGGYTCSCPAGFKLENNRRNCLACPGNTWGPECSQDCACGIGAKRCDPTTGCVCLTGFQGKYCTDDIDECEIHNLTCPGKQQCVNTYGGAKCVCPSGFQYDTKQNCVDINECSSEHSCTQICTNTVGSYICSCNEGYIYNATTNTCLDIDECREGTHKCHEKCDNTEGSYRCSCQTGLFLQLDGVSCEVDIPCINTTSCSEKCANINGIETCLCGKGKVLATDKTSCDDLDLCKNTSCTEGCVETKGNTSFECLCNTGKYLAADGTTCSECVNGKYGLNCSKICSCETANTKSCNVVDGTCECQSGWKGNNCTFDEDECGNGSASCQIHSRCINTLGSFTCVCNDGFILRESICKECDDDFYGANCSSHCSCGAHSKCNKTDGACYCKLGWKGNNCDIDIDECRENIHNCSSSLLEVCSNTEGGYKCVCNAGYTKLCDSCECKDINECASAENNSCSYKPGCNNTDGGYTCSCSAGYKLDNNGRNCQECTANTYGLNCSQSCTCVMANTKACDTINGHCLCLSGWKGDRCESDVNECTEQSVSCRQNSHCVNTAGSFTCLCDIGFYDDTNGQCKALLSTHKVAAIITLDYNISNINFADQSSENYQRLAENIQNGLLESLKKFEPSVISLTVTKLSKGSLIVETEITMGTQNSTEKASEVVLGKALVEMMQNGNAIRIDSTPVVMSALTLNGGELSKSDGACDIQSKIEPCSASDVCEEVGKEAVCKHKIEKDSQNLIIGLSVGLSLFTILFVSIWIIFCCWVKQNKAKNRVENNEPLDLFKSQTDRKSTLSKQLSTHGGGDDQSQGTDDNTDGSSWRNSVLAYQSSNSRITRPKLLVSGSMQNTSSDTKYRGHQGSADINGSGNEMMTSYNL